MTDLYRIQMLYGVKVMRPESHALMGWHDYSKVYADGVDQQGRPVNIKPRCGYCGHPPGNGQHKCLNCGAPK